MCKTQNIRLIDYYLIQEIELAPNIKMLLNWKARLGFLSVDQNYVYIPLGVCPLRSPSPWEIFFVELQNILQDHDISNP